VKQVQTTSSRESIDRLVAGKHYAQALPLLTEICRQQPRNVQKRQQLADVLTAVGETRKAFKVLEELVTDFARAGQVARAIAIVKRMQTIEPGRQDLDMKLAVLVTNQSSGGVQPPPQRATQVKGPDKLAEPAPVLDVADLRRIDDLIMQSSVEERLLFDASEGQRGKEDLLRGSKLLQGFSADELEELIAKLQLTSLQAGEIIVAEGQPGNSLFLIASGSVRVYVRNKSGAQRQVRVMHQGDFFGEISLLKGSRRTATITAASAAELLELDRTAVNAMAARHPKVWEIIEDFCIRRKDSIEEIGARSRD
jgi:hypothetical protein